MTSLHVNSPLADEQVRAAGPPPSAPTLSGVLTLATGTGVVLCWVAVGVVATARRDELHAWIHGVDPTTPAVDLANLFGMLGSMGLVAGFVTTGCWLVQMRKVADWYRPQAYHRRAAWWALAAWVVPVVNLWFPYQVVTDTGRALGSRTRTYLPWWIAWLVLGAGSVLAPRAGLADVADVDRWILAQQIDAVVVVVAGVLWCRIVLAVTAAARAATTVRT